MSGYIVKKTVIRHPWLIIKTYGIAIFFRCLFASKNTTFLSIIFKRF